MAIIYINYALYLVLKPQKGATSLRYLISEPTVVTSSYKEQKQQRRIPYLSARLIERKTSHLTNPVLYLSIYLDGRTHPERKKLTQSGTFPILPRLPAGAFSLNNHGFLEFLTNASYPEERKGPYDAYIKPVCSLKCLNLIPY